MPRRRPTLVAVVAFCLSGCQTESPTVSYDYRWGPDLGKLAPIQGTATNNDTETRTLFLQVTCGDGTPGREIYLENVAAGATAHFDEAALCESTEASISEATYMPLHR
jgi:hypothetical protein